MRAKTIALIALLVAIMIGVATVAAFSAGFTDWSKFDFVTDLFKRAPAPEPAPELKPYTLEITADDQFGSSDFAALIPKEIVDKMGLDDIDVVWNDETITLYFNFLNIGDITVKVWSDVIDLSIEPEKIAIAGFNVKTYQPTDKRGTLITKEIGTLVIPSILLPADWTPDIGADPEPEPEPEPEGYVQPVIDLVLDIDDFTVDFDSGGSAYVAYSVLDFNIDDWGLLPVAYTLDIVYDGANSVSYNGLLAPSGEFLGAEMGSGSYFCEISDYFFMVYNKVKVISAGSDPEIDENSATIVIIAENAPGLPTGITITITDINTYLAGLAG